MAGKKLATLELMGKVLKSFDKASEQLTVVFKNFKGRMGPMGRFELLTFVLANCDEETVLFLHKLTKEFGEHATTLFLSRVYGNAVGKKSVSRGRAAGPAAALN